jgi:hypothetical protein
LRTVDTTYDRRDDSGDRDEPRAAKTDRTSIDIIRNSGGHGHS